MILWKYAYYRKPVTCKDYISRVVEKALPYPPKRKPPGIWCREIGIAVVSTKAGFAQARQTLLPVCGQNKITNYLAQSWIKINLA